MADSGHIFARTYAASSLTPAMHNAEILSGMTQVAFMNQLAATEDLSDVVTKLKTIAATVLKQPTLRVAVTCGEDVVSANENALSRFISSLPNDDHVPQQQQSVSVAIYSVNSYDVCCCCWLLLLKKLII